MDGFEKWAEERRIGTTETQTRPHRCAKRCGQGSQRRRERTKSSRQKLNRPISARRRGSPPRFRNGRKITGRKILEDLGAAGIPAGQGDQRLLLKRGGAARRSRNRRTRHSHEATKDTKKGIWNPRASLRGFVVEDDSDRPLAFFFQVFASPSFCPHHSVMFWVEGCGFTE